MDAVLKIFVILLPHLLLGGMIYWTFKNWHQEWLEYQRQYKYYNKKWWKKPVMIAGILLLVDIGISGFISIILGLKGSYALVTAGLFAGNIFSQMFIVGRIKNA